jgi:hypothetical protein
MTGLQNTTLACRTASGWGQEVLYTVGLCATARQEYNKLQTDTLRTDYETTVQQALHLVTEYLEYLKCHENEILHSIGADKPHDDVASLLGLTIYYS